MNAVVDRAALVLSLALANLGRVGGRTRGLPVATRGGRILSVARDDGALLVDTGRGSVLVLVTWDAIIRGPDDVIGLEHIRTGDVVEWTDEGGQTVVMVEDLRVIPAPA
jgi:hypothetical protein